MEKKYDYFYRAEADQFTFYRIPKELMQNPEFVKLSSDSKILYGLLLDRMSLSRRNNWVDDKNRIYIVFTLKDAMEQLNKSHTTCSKLFKELEKYQLLSKVVRGLGKPAIIYLHNVFHRKSQISNFQNVEVKSAKMLKSGVQKSGSQDFQNLAPNDNEYNNTYFNDTESTNQSNINGNGLVDMEKYNKYLNLVKENIEFDILSQTKDDDYRESLSSVVNIIADFCTFTTTPVKINGNLISAELVKNKLLKLDSSDIEYVLHILNNTTKKITNPRVYTIAVLYNAKDTKKTFWKNEVNYDMFTSKKDKSVIKNSFNNFEKEKLYTDEEISERLRRKGQTCV